MSRPSDVKILVCGNKEDNRSDDPSGESLPPAKFHIHPLERASMQESTLGSRLGCRNQPALPGTAGASPC
jgi:hypothetical protein